MKKIIIVLFLSSTILNAQKIKSAGKWMGEGEFQNQPMIFGEDQAMETVLKAIEAYNSGDADLELSFYTDEYAKKNGPFLKEWHEKTSRLNMKPWVMFPVKIKGDNRTQVLSWSIEEREWKNGSKQKQNLMEIFVIDDETGKINNFVQWRRNFPDNEFGLSSGGKYLGKKDNGYTGRKIVFSNRGETEKMEALIKAYNEKDFETCKTFFVDGATVYGADGSKTIFKHKMWDSYFDNFVSIKWKPYSIAPLKIADTDPTSRVEVYAVEERTMKNGEIWKKELIEHFYFNLDGLINQAVQFERSME
jgi:hypothetical protein